MYMTSLKYEIDLKRKSKMCIAISIPCEIHVKSRGERILFQGDFLRSPPPLPTPMSSSLTFLVILDDVPKDNQTDKLHPTKHDHLFVIIYIFNPIFPTFPKTVT